MQHEGAKCRFSIHHYFDAGICFILPTRSVAGVDHDPRSNMAIPVPAFLTGSDASITHIVTAIVLCVCIGSFANHLCWFRVRYMPNNASWHEFSLDSQIVTYAITKVVCLAYFHPLSRFPGPRIAAASNVWYAYHWYAMLANQTFWKFSWITYATVGFLDGGLGQWRRSCKNLMMSCASRPTSLLSSSPHRPFQVCAKCHCPEG